MRNNQPTTNREVLMAEGSMIVSRTNEKGLIEFVNKDFLDISGFTKDELIGEPHNIIRHPDMPSEAFEDMWRDLKSGLPWSGFVKNRVKNGDHYWVQASAMPLKENGRITGFISIRKKPDSETVRKVSDIYKKFKEGTASGLSIQHGRIVDGSMSSRVSKYFDRFSGKITAVAGALCLMILAIGGTGIYLSSQITESLRTVYEDRTVAAGQLADIAHALSNSMFHLSVLSGNDADAAGHIKEVEEVVPEMTKVWGEYMATYLTPEEKALADHYTGQQQKYIEVVVKPALELAKAHKSAELDKLVRQSESIYDEAIETNGKLMNLQLDVAKDEYNKSKVHHAVGQWLSVGVIFLGLIVAFFSSRYLRNKLIGRLSTLDTQLNSIAGGNYNTEITYSNDELQTIVTTVEALQAKLAYGELEKKQAEIDKKLSQAALADRFEGEVGAVVNIISSSATELQATAESMTSTAEETSQQATTVAAASEQATVNVQTVSAATEELTSSIKEIQMQVSQSTKKINDAVLRANDANEKVLSLTDAAQKIGNVVSIISAIAGQTNLLALNATIEAARAGEAGKGFAVVASEVKNLAGQTAKATEEISMQVAQIQEKTASSVDAIRAITQVIGEVNTTATAIAAAVEEQGSATQEIARNVSEAASGTQEVSSNILGVRQAAQSTGAAAGQVLSAAGELAKNGESLKSQVKTFLASVRGG